MSLELNRTATEGDLGFPRIDINPVNDPVDPQRSDTRSSTQTQEEVLSELEALAVHQPGKEGRMIKTWTSDTLLSPTLSIREGDPPPSLSQMKKIGDDRKRIAFLERQTGLRGKHKAITYLCSNLTSTTWFQQFIITMILVTGACAGASTYKSMQEGIAFTVLEVMDQTILYIFTLEIVLKVLAMGRKPWAFFQESWNVFDFLVVFMCYPWLDLGFNPSFLRIIRLLRVLKLLNALPELSILVMCLIKSFNSMIYILLLLFLLFYLYGVMACFVFQDNDPMHFGKLEVAFLSLYRISTFEDWTDIMYINIYGCARYYYRGTGSDPPGYINYDGTQTPKYMRCDPKKSSEAGAVGALFFVSFTVLSTFIVFNLFVGVILTNIESAKEETIEEIRVLAFDDKILEKNKRDFRGARDGVADVVQQLDKASEMARKIADLEEFVRRKKPPSNAVAMMPGVIL